MSYSVPHRKWPCVKLESRPVCLYVSPSLRSRLVFQTQSASFEGGKGVNTNGVLVILNEMEVGSGQDNYAL